MSEEKIVKNPLLVLETEIIENEQDKVQLINEKKADNSLGISNPRFFEDVMPLKQAKQQRLAKYGDLNISKSLDRVY
ncbi:MAG: hypothetical protein KGD73_11020 [Candidatus Lokiarchaeota archaeon]|nr:hypothetical protein [Candidatus Lokiarchaeota archaeon]